MESLTTNVLFSITIELSRDSEKYKLIDLESAEDNEADKRVGETLSEELKRASSLTERTLNVVVNVVDPPLPSSTTAEILATPVNSAGEKVKFDKLLDVSS